MIKRWNKITELVNDKTYLEYIINDFSTVLDDKNKTFIWKCEKIIELMDNLKVTNNRDLVRKILPTILSLSEDYNSEFNMAKMLDLENILEYKREFLIKILRETV